MTNQQRIFRGALLLSCITLGYWMDGVWGAFAAWAWFIGLYLLFCLANGIVQGIQRMTEPKIQVDNRTLNMNVETGSAIKGTPFTVVHKDPTRPDRELTK